MVTKAGGGAALRIGELGARAGLQSGGGEAGQ